MTPDSPPMMNIAMKPIAKCMGVLIWSEPPHIVPIQLNILTPVGTAIRNVISEKNGRNTWPVVNMWWAQTEKPRAPMPAVANTNAL